MNFITDYTIYFDEMHNHKFDLEVAENYGLRISSVNYSLQEVNTFLIEYQKLPWGHHYLVHRWSKDEFFSTRQAFIYFDHALEFCKIESLDIDVTNLLEMWEAKTLAFKMLEASA